MRYGSPTSWLNHNEDDLDMDSIGESETSEDSFENPSGLRIEFKSEFLAEAVDRLEGNCELDDVNTENTWLWKTANINVTFTHASSREFSRMGKMEIKFSENFITGICLGAPGVCVRSCWNMLGGGVKPYSRYMPKSC